MDFLWLPLEEAFAKILSGEIVNSIAVGGILAANRVINHGGATRRADAPFDLRPQSLAARRQGPDMKKLWVPLRLTCPHTMGNPRPRPSALPRRG